MCPEILNGNPYSTKSDVWSTGIIIYQMLFGKTPHRANNLEELVMKVNKKMIRYPQKINNEKLQKLMENMLQHDPADRISWGEIFKHELFNEEKSRNGVNDSMQIA